MKKEIIYLRLNKNLKEKLKKEAIEKGVSLNSLLNIKLSKLEQ